MQAKSKWKTWHKVVLGILICFIVLMIVAVNSGKSADEPPTKKTPNLNAQEYSASIQSAGYGFSSPTDIAGQQRISYTGSGLLCNVFSSAGIIKNIHIVRHSSLIRDDLQGDFERYEKLLSTVDEKGAQWVRDTLRTHGGNADFEDETTIEGVRYSVSFTQTNGKDILVIDLNT